MILYLNNLDADDYFNDKRKFSFLFLITIISFALIISSTVYFYKVSSKKR
ncbi:MAG TPA: hypothetical protein VJ962_01985 [Clostridia bacterium]|nr:hypothetical protein [Clostridia bacterium]